MAAPARAPRLSRFAAARAWLDARAGSERLLRQLLDEPIPGGVRWAYVFGSGLLFLLMAQVVTGILLALYYVPAANDAHVTVAYIVKAVSAGSFLRSLHAYGAAAIVIVMLLHLGQTFLYGSYKGRRELVWLAGCGLLAAMLAMAFTGCLLPWDQRAYFATAVGTNVIGEVPVVGNYLKLALRGGSQMGTVTLSRFFVLHVFVLPAVILLLVAAHVFFFRKAGPAGPPAADPLQPDLPTQPFAPGQLQRDTIFALLLVAVLAGLAHWAPVALGPQANPADTTYLPRPEWYFLPMFQWLKFWPGRSAVIGIAVLPAILTVLFVGAPFLDRSLQRHPLRRPGAVGLFCLVLGGMIGIGILSRVQDARDPIVAGQLLRQKREEAGYMRLPFAPLALGEASSAAPVATPVAGAVAAPAAAPAAAAKTAAPSGESLYFTTYRCNRCHGDFGEGGDFAPALAGLGWPAARLAAFLRHPSDAASQAGMPAIADPRERAALIAYLQNLK